jgi:hypothetical protein
MMWEVPQTTFQVAQESRLVEVSRQALVDFCQNRLPQHPGVPAWEDSYHFRGSARETVAYLLVLDSLNFCFWPDRGKPKWEIVCGSESLSGYFGLAAALKRAVESGIPLTRADYLARLSLNDLREILGGPGGELPLMSRRREILNNVGRVLMEAYDGQATNLIEAAQRSAVTLSRLLAEKFPSFRDTADYRGSEVFFYKRGQILASDLHGTFEGKSWGRFDDMEELTAFADYKLPQVLRHLGIFIYEESLACKVDQGVFLKAGSLEEVEVRANTIWAVELIRRELGRLGKTLRAFEIDWILWNLGQDPVFKVKPYHRTRTVFY